MQKYLELIGDCPLFRDIDDSQIQAAVEYLNAYVIEFEKSSAIFHEDDLVDKAGIILLGRAEIRENDYNGNSALISELTAGQMFGEALCSTSTSKIPMSVYCAEACTVLFFDCKALLDVNRANKFQSILLRNLLSELSKKTLQLREKINILSQKTTREKLMAYLLKQSKKAGKQRFLIPLDRQSLADYLGVDRSAMSAEISKLQKEGIIKTRKFEFEILKKL